MTKRGGIATRLRERIMGGIETGALRAGDRLPSARELAPQFDADPRVVASAYRTLSMEALVEVRPKSGVFVSHAACNGQNAEKVPVNWLAEVFVEAVRKGLPISELGSVVFDFSETRRIRAAVVADTVDQAMGIAAELKREYGLNATPHHIDELRGKSLSPKLAAARVFFAANDCAMEVSKVARMMSRPMVAIALREDLFDAAWLSLLQTPSYVVVTDAAFAQKIPRIFPKVVSRETVTVLVVGSDDLSAIPPDAPTYVTESARRSIGKTRLPGRVIRPRRLFSDDSVRDVVCFIMAHNSDA